MFLRAPQNWWPPKCELPREVAEEASSACRRAMRLSGDMGLLGRVGTRVLRRAPVVRQASNTCTDTSTSSQRKEKKRKEKKRKGKERKGKERKAKKRKEKTTPLGADSTESLVIHKARPTPPYHNLISGCASTLALHMLSSNRLPSTVSHQLYIATKSQAEPALWFW